jgi:hypothetical protein
MSSRVSWDAITVWTRPARAGALAAAALLALAACSTPAPSDGGAVGAPAAEVVDVRSLVVLTTPPSQPFIATAAALGYSVQAVHPLPRLGDDLVSLRIPTGRTIPQAIEEIEAAAPGVTAGANHAYRLQAATRDDAGAARFYAHALIDWPEQGCRAVRAVGMVDGGLPPTHPGLADGLIVQQRFATGDERPSADHGAMVAGLLIGEGRLTGARLYSADVIDPGLDGGDATGVVEILRAVNWLRAQGVDLVNVSLAGPRNKLLNRGLGRAASEGMVLVAAVGNTGPSSAPRYPAAFPFALAVTAVDSDAEVYSGAARGEQIDLAAPGVDILLREDGRLRIVTGTSVAAPFVTAAIAADPGGVGLDVGALRRRLAAQAVDLGEPGRDPVFGDGLLAAPQACRRG